jgi:hypothetical protein
MKFGDGVPESALIKLARMILTRAKLRGMDLSTRDKAVAVILGLRPAPRKTAGGGISSLAGDEIYESEKQIFVNRSHSLYRAAAASLGRVEL